MKRPSPLHTLLSLIPKRTSPLTPTNQPTILSKQPSVDNDEAWPTYWTAQGQPWRTEPEIDAKRQQELSRCRAIVPDIEKGIYPFKGIKLSRADVEWLLATHENGRGPVDWSDESQRQREGLDLRGADLRQIDLQKLPLAGLCGGLTGVVPYKAKEEQYEMAIVCMDEADLNSAHLEGANLVGAQLKGANLQSTHLEEANLNRALLKKANLFFAHLKGADLSNVNLSGADLNGADLSGADLMATNLSWATIGGANLTGAVLDAANLVNADLTESRLERVSLTGVILGNSKHIGPQFADVRWDGTNLAVVDWSQVRILGDENSAVQKKSDEGENIEKSLRLYLYRRAVRANRQLAVALQAQGMNEEAACFAYRAQVLQRKVLWIQRDLGKWLFSALLALLTGYGYRMWRIIGAYVFVVSICAVAYFILGMYYSPHLSLLEAFLESITAFHGRVFYELFNPEKPQIWVTAFEAVAGLVIEGVFIAMLTQRYFGK